MAKKRECKNCLEEEEWRPVVGYEGRYEVSSHGRVRSMPRTTINSLGREYHFRQRVLSPDTSVKGYHVVTLHDRDRGRRKRVHRLVAEAFHGNPREGAELVRHLDHEVGHNCPVNLAWGTARDNAQDSIKDGRPFGNNGNGLKTECPRGHAYDGVSRRGDGRTFRYCRVCRNAASARDRERRRALA